MYTHSAQLFTNRYLKRPVFLRILRFVKPQTKHKSGKFQKQHTHALNAAQLKPCCFDDWLMLPTTVSSKATKPKASSDSSSLRVTRLKNIDKSTDVTAVGDRNKTFSGNATDTTDPGALLARIEQNMHLLLSTKRSVLCNQLKAAARLVFRFSTPS